MNKNELAAHCNHIKNYGHNWGKTFLKRGIVWRRGVIRNNTRENKLIRAEIKAYGIALRGMR